jgi:predicted nucleic acid-binding protein
VALLDRSDADHARCVAALATLNDLRTTWPCLTEAMYLLGQEGGLFAQDQLWGFVADGLVSLHVPADDEWERMRTLMRKYGDSPMDLADASIVTAAERLNVRRVFTLDRTLPRVSARQRACVRRHTLTT